MTDHQPTITARGFVVGCPRSGTTLLQALLAGHPDIYSLPETHFFRYVAPGRLWGDVARWMGLASRRSASRLARLLGEMGRADLAERLPKPGRVARLVDRVLPAGQFSDAPTVICRRRKLIRDFLGLLDDLAIDAGAQVWVEKTPAHVFYIHHIQKHVANARFIHLVRRGEDAVASLHDAAGRFPDQVWGKAYPTIDACIAEWNRSVVATKRWAGQPGHLVVRYEQLIERPAQTLAAITDLLGLRRMDEVDVSAKQAESLIRPDEPWKAAVSSGVRKPEDKFTKLFDEAQQQFIRERLVDVGDLACNEPLRSSHP